MFCGQCGTERVTEDARFCRSCGTTFSASVPLPVTHHNLVDETTAVRPVVDPTTASELTPSRDSEDQWSPAAPSMVPTHPAPPVYPSGRAWAPAAAAPSDLGPPFASTGAGRLPLYAAAVALLLIGGLIGYVAVAFLLPL